MSTASRARQRRARSRHASRSSSVVPYILIGAGVVALLGLATLLSRSDGGGDGAATEVLETAPVSIQGDALPVFEGSVNDAAVGLEMPAISGRDFFGRRVGIADDGNPKIVMFLAHWCPHCQAEVPVVQQWLNQGATHGPLDLISIATATDATQPNYPPSEWLDGEGWTAPVILDDAESSAGAAAGVSSYPFFVFVDGDGTVSSRAAGKLSIESIEAAVSVLKHPMHEES